MPSRTPEKSRQDSGIAGFHENDNRFHFQFRDDLGSLAEDLQLIDIAQHFRLTAVDPPTELQRPGSILTDLTPLQPRLELLRPALTAPAGVEFPRSYAEL